MTYKSGFVALIGKPNVGKSTLLNSILKKKVAIATPKPQTTRDNIRGILTLEDSQIIFVDTPGIHKAKSKLNQSMVKQAYQAIGDVDIILMLIDGQKGLEIADKIIIESIAKINKPKFLVLNKIDKLNKSELIELLQGVDQDIFNEIIPVSALKSKNVDELINTVKKYLPDTIQYYPSDMICDYNENFLFGEIIREKVLLFTQQEVPHCVAVVIEKVENKKDLAIINAKIVCEKQSQKKIIIGHQGEMMKKIASAAREELAERLNKKVYLEVFVAIEENWRNKNYQLQQLGYGDKKDE